MVLLDATTIDQNDLGVDVGFNGTALIRDGSRVADNSHEGVTVNTGGMFGIADAVVEDNGGYGIVAGGASTVSIERSNVIRSNGLDGILLWDQSNGVGGHGLGTVIEISDNGGWGINCAGPPAIAPFQNQFNMANIQFSGNANPGTNCPQGTCDIDRVSEGKGRELPFRPSVLIKRLLGHTLAILVCRWLLLVPVSGNYRRPDQ